MKTKLIKLSNTHYIIVDDSEIKYNDWVINGNGKIFQYTKESVSGINYCKKIISSTFPLEMQKMNSLGSHFAFVKIKELPLSEVEEAINGYSVEKMADSLFEKESHHILHPQHQMRECYIKGFNAHKELVKDKLFTTEDIYNAVRYGLDLCLKEKDWAFGVSGSAKPHIKDYIQSLLQKEWDVTFDEQGKIKLV